MSYSGHALPWTCHSSTLRASHPVDLAARPNSRPTVSSPRGAAVQGVEVPAAEWRQCRLRRWGHHQPFLAGVLQGTMSGAVVDEQPSIHGSIAERALEWPWTMYSLEHILRYEHDPVDSCGFLWLLGLTCMCDVGSCRGGGTRQWTRGALTGSQQAVHLVRNILRAGLTLGMLPVENADSAAAWYVSAA